jgi:transposase
LAVDAHGMPLRAIITSGTQADCQSASALMEGMKAKALLADKGYDSDAVVEQARTQGMQPHIPSRKNRKQPRPFDKGLYKLRHRVEIAFLHLNP